MYKMKIRGHHLRNLEYLIWEIQSSGQHSNYSEFYRHYDKNDYAENILKKIIENPFLKIAIVDSLDDICVMCGNHDGANCAKNGEDEKKLKRFDRKVSGKFGLVVGRSYSSDDFLFRLDRPKLKHIYGFNVWESLKAESIPV